MAMAQMGVGGAFLRVTEALLSNTRARASVNGATSRAAEFQAVVRRGARHRLCRTSSLAKPWADSWQQQALGYQWMENGWRGRDTQMV